MNKFHLIIDKCLFLNLIAFIFFIFSTNKILNLKYLKMKKIVKIFFSCVIFFAYNNCIAQNNSDAVSGATATYSEKLPDSELFQLIKES